MNELMNKIKRNLSFQIEQRFYEVGLGYREYSFGLKAQLLKEVDYHIKRCSFIESAKIQCITLERLRKKDRRYVLNIVARYKLPRKLTHEQKKYLNTQRAKDIYKVRVVSKTIIEISDSYILAPKGSTKGYYASGSIYRKETGWQFRIGEELPIIKDKNDLLKNRLEKLISIVGKRAYNALKENKATLQVWRRSQPFNWFIESKSGKQLWHSDHGERPDLSLFEKKSDSKEIISVPAVCFIHIPGNGEPEHTEYSYIGCN